MIYSVKAYKGKEIRLEMKYRYFQSFKSFYKGLLESLSHDLEEDNYSEGIDSLIVLKLDEDGNKISGFKVLKTKMLGLITQILSEEQFSNGE